MFTRLSSLKKKLFIKTDLSKQWVIDADLKARQEINFTENLDQLWNTNTFLVLEEVKETNLDNTGLSLIKNVLKTLYKIVLILLRLTAVVSAAYVGIHK